MTVAQTQSVLAYRLFESPGYAPFCYLLPKELALLRTWIRQRALTPEAVRDKANRLFTPEEVERVKGFEFLKAVRNELGEYRLSDVVVGTEIQRGREEVYFRIVRPGEENDVGPLHRDTEHHARVPGLHPAGEETVKAWIAIDTEPGRNGLLVVPDSHRSAEQTPELLRLHPGDIVLFNENLLHGGAVNRGTRARVSVEITLCFKRGRS